MAVPRQHRAFQDLPDPWGTHRKTAEPQLQRYRQAVSMQWMEARDLKCRVDLNLLDEAMRMDGELDEWERKEMSVGRPLHQWWISAPNFPVKEAQLLDWWELLTVARLLADEKLFDLFLQKPNLASRLRSLYFWGFRRGYAIAAKREDGGTTNAPSEAMQEKIKVALSTGLIAVDCPECGVVFGLSLTFQGRRREDGETFHCPNGHSNYYPTGISDGERERLRLLAALDQAEAAAFVTGQ